MTTQNETIHYDAGSAFPNDSSNGMTLRDWFAGMAMQVDLASEGPEFFSSGADRWKTIATNAYKMADAMIIARQQCQKP